MNKLNAACRSYLEELKKEGTYRQLRDCQALTDFQSNDYLGLSYNTEFSQALLTYLCKSGVPSLSLRAGSTGSRLISGSNAIISEFEDDLAAYYGGEAAIYFSSGYMANLALITALASLQVIFYYDEYVHASQRDGLKLTRAKALSFNHQNWDHLEQRLENRESESLPVILVESLYSMEGDYFDLAEFSKRFSFDDFHLVVDAAHTGGLEGFNSQIDGINESQAAAIKSNSNLIATPQISLRESGRSESFSKNRTCVYTFGKSYTVGGAIIICSALLKELIINKARSFIYTTAPSPLQVLSARFAHEYVQTHHKSLIERLKENCHYFRELAQNRLGLNFGDGPIFPFIIPGNPHVWRLAESLRKKGFAVTAIRSPTVPKTKERIRIVVHAHNSFDQIKALIEAFKTLGVPQP